jgi:hypothetical protein
VNTINNISIIIAASFSYKVNEARAQLQPVGRVGCSLKTRKARPQRQHSHIYVSTGEHQG